MKNSLIATLQILARAAPLAGHAVAAMVAAFIITQGLLRPMPTWDSLQYASLAKQWRDGVPVAEASRLAHQEMLRTDTSRWAVSGGARYMPFIERARDNPELFAVLEPFYTVKPLHIAVTAGLGWLLSNDIYATVAASTLGIALLMLISYGLVLLHCAWPAFFILPVAWLLAGLQTVAPLGTPDGLGYALAAAVVAMLLASPLRTKRQQFLFALACCMLIAARSDSILLILLIVAAGLYTDRFTRGYSLTLGFTALLTYAGVNWNQYSYSALMSYTLAFNLIDVNSWKDPAQVSDFLLHHQLGIRSYLKALRHGLQAVLQMPASPYLFFALLALLNLARLGEIRAALARQRIVDGELAALVLTMALPAFVAMHFLLFPIGQLRFLSFALVGTVLLCLIWALPREHRTPT